MSSRLTVVISTSVTLPPLPTNPSRSGFEGPQDLPRHPDLDDLHLARVDRRPRPGEAELGGDERHGERRANGEAKRDARIGVQARGEIQGKNGAPGAIEALDRRFEQALDGPRQPGAEQGVDDP